MVLSHVLFLIVGLVALVKGAEVFVEAASRVARLYGVSEFVIGLTVVAVGTSVPELVASLFAAAAGEGGIVAGTNVGGNLANIGLLIGVAALIKPFATERDMVETDGVILFLISVAFFGLLLDGSLGRLEGGTLILIYVAYVAFLVTEKPKLEGRYGFRVFLRYFVRMQYVNGVARRARRGGPGARRLVRRTFLRDAAVMALGGAGIFLGADLVVGEATWLAGFLGVSGNVVGLTVLAIGTSLPELSVTVTAARRGLGSIVVGSVLGSNVARVTLIMGSAALVEPLEVPRITVLYTVPFMIVLTGVFVAFLRRRWDVDRVEGVVLLLLYAGFLAWYLVAVG